MAREMRAKRHTVETSLVFWMLISEKHSGFPGRGTVRLSKLLFDLQAVLHGGESSTT
jgi:hypothetical protein